MTTIHIVDAFTQSAGAGNRAGVVLKADGLTDAQMQEIARFAGYSETAFVLSATSADHDLQVRYFTPHAEVPICGHATIATHYLRALQLGGGTYAVRAKTGAGILPVRLLGAGEDAQVEMTQGAVHFGHILTAREHSQLRAGLGLRSADLVAGHPVQVVSTGHSKVMVPLRDRALVDGVALNESLLSQLSAQIDCNGFFTFAMEQNAAGHLQTYGRMFAPAIGIIEDPVTGNANGPAGAYLWKYGMLEDVPEQTYAGHQGHKMGKPGTIYVTVSDAADQLSIRISGHAVLAGTRNYPD